METDTRFTQLTGVIIAVDDLAEEFTIRLDDGTEMQRWYGLDIHALAEGHDGMYEVGDRVSFYEDVR